MAYKGSGGLLYRDILVTNSGALYVVVRKKAIYKLQR